MYMAELWGWKALTLRRAAAPPHWWESVEVVEESKVGSVDLSMQVLQVHPTARTLR